MARCVHVLLVGLGVIGAAFAGEAPDSAHTPPGSAFKTSGPETLEWPRRSTIKYEGRATVSVRYRFVHVGADDEESAYGQNPYLVFLPDSASQAALPYLTRWVFESDHSRQKVLWTERAEEVWVTNVADAAAGLLGAELAAEVLEGKHGMVVGEAVVVIEGFSAGYECERPSFATRFVAVEHAVSAPQTAKRESHGC